MDIVAVNEERWSPHTPTDASRTGLNVVREVLAMQSDGGTWQDIAEQDNDGQIASRHIIHRIHQSHQYQMTLMALVSTGYRL